MSHKFRPVKAQAPTSTRLVNLKGDYQRWGTDDRYPNRIRALVNASGTASSSLGTKAKLIEGNGFKDQAFWKAVINRKGQTVDQILRMHSKDLADLNGLAFLLNLNANGYPCEALHLPIHQWRPGLPDDSGRIDLAWIKYAPVKGKPAKKPTVHLVFDPAEPPADRAARILNWPGGIAAYPGEVFFYIHEPAEGYLPEASYTSVLVDIEAEGLLKKSRRTDVRSGFTARTVITEYGTDDPSEEKMDADLAKYEPFVGEDGDRIVVQWAKDTDSRPTIDTLQSPDASDRYAKDGETLKRDIRAVFQIPDILYGEAVAGKLGTQSEFEDAITYVQNFVVNTDQRAIETAYTAVFSQFQPLGNPGQVINPSRDFSIQNLTLDATQTADESEAEKMLKALATLPTDIRAQVLQDLLPDERRALVGAKPLIPPATTDANPDPNAG